MAAFRRFTDVNSRAYREMNDDDDDVNDIL